MKFITLLVAAAMARLSNAEDYTIWGVRYTPLSITKPIINTRCLFFQFCNMELNSCRVLLPPHADEHGRRRTDVDFGFMNMPCNNHHVSYYIFLFLYLSLLHMYPFIYDVKFLIQYTKVHSSNRIGFY